MNAIVWHREDLRLSDNPALSEAIAQGYDILPIYILDGIETSRGSASKGFLHQALSALNKSYEQKGAKLHYRQGDSLEILKEYIREHNIKKIFWNRCYSPDQITRDSTIKAELSNIGIKTQSFNAKLWHEPWDIQNKQGNFFKVFTPYWNHVKSLKKTSPISSPSNIQGINANSSALEDLELLPNKDWVLPILSQWPATEEAAHETLNTFLEKNLDKYSSQRDNPFENINSSLSPYLALGIISPNQINEKIQSHLFLNPESEKDAEKFLSEICWREFSYHILYHFPKLKTHNWQPLFDKYPWEENSSFFNAWKTGNTGFPIVDAGMRELWATGYMHNRVRMIVASFLIKDLFIDWRIGESWFWDCLVDADYASNAASWQWVAGSGFDASPYFRVFNPTTQSKKFDSEGDYIRKWVPELSQLNNKYIHEPTEAPQNMLINANIKLGKDYPFPIVNHSNSRLKALSIYKDIKEEK